MAKHQSKSEQAKHTQLTSIGNAWHRCERFLILGKRCPFQTADIEEDDDQDPESQRRPLLLSPPARRRQLQDNTLDVTAEAETFDIRDFVNLPTPQPVLPEGPRPDRPIPPKPGTPDIPKTPVPLNIETPRLPDGMPIITPPPTINPNDIGRLIQWLNTQFITGLANKPAFSPSPLATPLVKSSRMPAQQLDAFLLQESAQEAGSAEATFARQSASLMKPVSTIEREVNQSSSKSRESRITGRQIVGAGAAIAAGAAGAMAFGGRTGGGGGLHFPSRFPRDPAMAR